MRAVPISEAVFQRSVIEMAKHLGWKVAHFHDSRREVRPGVWVGDTRAKGFPDLILVRGQRLIAAELKREKEKETRAQREWLDALAPACEVYLWKPSAWDEIEMILR